MGSHNTKKAGRGRGTYIRYGKQRAEVDVSPVGPRQGGRGDVLLGHCHLGRLADPCTTDIISVPRTSVGVAGV